MQRREFITLLGGAAAAWPLAVRAQQQPMPVVGFLERRIARTAASADRGVPRGSEGIRLCRRPERGGRIPLGGRSVRPTAGTGGRSGPPAGERDRLDGGAPAVLAAKAATTTIPIVFTAGDDPVKLGPRR